MNFRVTSRFIGNIEGLNREDGERHLHELSAPLGDSDSAEAVVGREGSIE